MKYVTAFTIIFFLMFCSPALAANEPSCSDLGVCLAGKFNSVFPFDIFAGIPPGTDLACPALSFFNREFEFCFLWDALRVLKYPTLVALLIKIYLFS